MWCPCRLCSGRPRIPPNKKIFDKIVSQAQLGLTEPEDLADTILFLASPLSRRITGQVISVNGGISVA
ncbi:SDR family oxidoreductase [Rhodococcus opacus]|uniref:SDR family oxidoreductase n=1 Tax=Rhodococcus opacus TaxID=37919 RepID=UPI001E2A0553|nr:SDR family oxidoreductase [Rhodococcus opacus]